MQGSAAGQPVATLVKAVTTQAGTSLPSMTIPVSTVNLHNVNISVSMPQQKAGATATKQLTAQQIRGLQLQQLQQQQRKTSQLQQQQKVAGMSSTFNWGVWPGQTVGLHSVGLMGWGILGCTATEENPCVQIMKPDWLVTRINSAVHLWNLDTRSDYSLAALKVT